jgi:nucleotide-binding universal stress UspA family protein
MIAANGSPNSRRAVEYVAALLGGLPGFRLTILDLIPLPPQEHFETDKEREAWLKGERESAAARLKEFRHTCISAGFPEESVEAKASERHCASISDCILEEVREAGACTLVVGRRGLSMKEEFLFGSTSSQVLHDARGCAVWVVE